MASFQGNFHEKDWLIQYVLAIITQMNGIFFLFPPTCSILKLVDFCQSRQQKNIFDIQKVSPIPDRHLFLALFSRHDIDKGTRLSSKTKLISASTEWSITVPFRRRQSLAGSISTTKNPYPI